MKKKHSASQSVKKGGTVVPPSDFQSVTTYDPNREQLSKKGSRPLGRSARAHTCAPAYRLNVLIACEESQAECKAFRELGHNAYSCDLQKCRISGNPDWHIVGDVTPYLEGQLSFVTQSGKKVLVNKWDLIIAHPPCTYLCKVGSQHLYHNPDKMMSINGEERFINSHHYAQMLDARDFFYRCLNARCYYVAVENPIPMRLAGLPHCDTYVCPSWFGVKYTKKTLYWLKNLPPIVAEINHSHPKCYTYSSRGKYRSRTFPQLAKAIAKQWSEFILDEMRIKGNKCEL